MNKKELEAAISVTKSSTREALQLLYDNINKGQQKQIIKREEIKKLFNIYNVKY